MVRYDPTQDEHKKYVKDKHELPKQKRPKKQKIEQTKITAEPIVDTDKYYKIGDKLKDVFSTSNDFSFTSLFHTSDKSELILNITFILRIFVIFFLSNTIFIYF